MNEPMDNIPGTEDLAGVTSLLDTLGRHERSRADGGLEERLTRATSPILTASHFSAGRPASRGGWAISPGTRLAAGLALAAMVAAAMMGRGRPGAFVAHASAASPLITEADWALILPENPAESLLADTQALRESINTTWNESSNGWITEDVLSGEEAM